MVSYLTATPFCFFSLYFLCYSRCFIPYLEVIKGLIIQMGLCISELFLYIVHFGISYAMSLSEVIRSLSQQKWFLESIISITLLVL